MTVEEISDRNGMLISFISALDLGIHITQLPHKPKLLSPDSKYWLNAYVKNFHLILTPSQHTEEVYLDIRLKPIKNMDIEGLKQKVLEWMVMFEHKRIYMISIKDSPFFISGYNHHNKILKKNSYPVFAKYDPIIYKELERAEKILERFKDEYDLVIN